MVHHNKWRRVALENIVIMITTKKIGKVMLGIWSYFLQQTTLPMRKKRKLSISCGIEKYRLFKGLTAPAKHVEKTFDELVTLNDKS